jgi:hypothetical protein
MAFVTMDPELARKAIEGIENVLEPERLKFEAFYRQFKCERCGGEYHKEFSRRHAFPEGGENLIARALLRCSAGRALFDPFSGMYVEMGNPAAVPPAIPIIKPSSE